MSKQLSFFLDPTSCEQISDPKEYFFNIVSACLLKETKYYASSDSTRDEICRVMNKITQTDPEFILQTAYYVRNRMYIRTVSNFIVAFSILNAQTAQFVPTYFNGTILIPGDLIEVCQFVQVINLINQGIPIGGAQDLRKKLFFPSLLRACVANKLKEFSLYQLGKQCSESNRKKVLQSYKDFFHPERVQQRQDKRRAKLMALKKQVEGNMDAEQQVQVKITQRTGKARKNQKKHQFKPEKHQCIADKNIFDIKFVTLKDIVRFCHICQPKQLVMSIMGKKYPKTKEEFEQTFYVDNLEGQNLQFEVEKAGKRMQVPIPITWERELSSKGKSTQVWADLVFKNQLPYMATIRNLRNLLLADLPHQAHQILLEKISNQKAVEGAKMFPLQYFNAISELDKLLTKYKELLSQTKPQQAKRGGRDNGRGRSRGGRDDGRGGRDTSQSQEPIDPKVEEKFLRMQEQYSKLKEPIIESYMQSVEKAIKISIDKNLEPIPGATYVFCDVSGSMGNKISGGKSYGSVSTCQDCAFILGLMIKQKCQICEFYLFSNPQNNMKAYEKVDVDTENLLEGMKRCQQLSLKMGKSHEMIGETIENVLLKPKVHADNVIVLSDMMVTQGFSESGSKRNFQDVIKEYIHQVNPQTKFFFLDISGYGQQVTFGDEFKSKNCFTITGMSDNVLRYIAIAGQKSQIEDVKEFSAQAKIPKKQQQPQQAQKVEQAQQENKDEIIQDEPIQVEKQGV